MTNFMMKLARFMAILGGIVLSFLIIMTCVSILGRLLNGVFHSDLLQNNAPDLAKWMIDIGVGPVNGDFELVEAGVAFAIFAFIPLCQMTAGHASVDIFTSMFSKNVNRFLRMVIEIIFAAVLILIAWRLFEGLVSKFGYGETTFLLQFPIWWSYLASFVGVVTAAAAGCYMAWIRTLEFFTKRIYIHDGAEAEL